ncbi:ATP-binding protein [Actinomadura sp. 3N407]|uniref:ATP-binding protein n=1 Tax=Actinomadura sp. 3N407 TaxID=3457423 RepID=UPI003FCD1F76
MNLFTKEVAGMRGECDSTVVLEPTEGAPAKARRFVAGRLAEWGIGDDHDGRLIVSELVTNALVHGDGPIVVRVFQDERDGLPVIEVWDGGEGRPVMRAENYAATDGRGLLMVAMLAHDWGTRPLVEGGKIAWAKCGL